MYVVISLGTKYFFAAIFHHFVGEKRPNNIIKDFLNDLNSLDFEY
jgi:hypothetical protein